MTQNLGPIPFSGQCDGMISRIDDCDRAFASRMPEEICNTSILRLFINMSRRSFDLALKQPQLCHLILFDPFDLRLGTHVPIHIILVSWRAHHR